MNYYRFVYGAYSDSGEEWLTHERAMTPKEVVDLLRSKWPEIRERLKPLWDEHKKIVAAKHLAKDYKTPWPEEPPAPQWELLMACGFVPLDATEIDADAFFDSYGDRIAWIDRHLLKMGAEE